MCFNGFANPEHRIVRSDIREYLARLTPRDVWDLAVVDPPTFSNTKGSEVDWDVQRDHAELLRQLALHIAPTGVVYFSTNFRRFKLDESVLAGLGLRWHEITNQTIPPDFRNKRIHRCWKMTFGGGAEQGDRE